MKMRNREKSIQEWVTDEMLYAEYGWEKKKPDDKRILTPRKVYAYLFAKAILCGKELKRETIELIKQATK